jgi:putative tryptophan/tyrosine transport system substrate-binding protein
MNSRRKLLAAFSGIAVAGARSVMAQQPMKRLGVLFLPSREVIEKHSDPRPLASLGWVEGKTFERISRYAEFDAVRFDRLSQEIVAEKPDVIMCGGVTATRAMQKATRVIPICTIVDDPVAHGFAKSLRRPGGNITGLSEGAEEGSQKEIELIRAALPAAVRLAIISGASDTPTLEQNSRSIIGSARGARLQVLVRHVENRKDIEEVLEWAGRGGVVLVRQMLEEGAATVSKLATARGIPVVGQHEMVLESGVLMTYRPVVADPQQIAAMLDRLLRGGNPAEIPFEMPTRSVFGINRKAADALGIKFPADFIVRADRVF